MVRKAEAVKSRSYPLTLLVVIDPTTLNAQGPDRGSQYRSAIFYHSPEQKEIAEKVTAKVQQEHYKGSPIVTAIVPAGAFYDAESYHQVRKAPRWLCIKGAGLNHFHFSWIAILGEEPAWIRGNGRKRSRAKRSLANISLSLF